MNTNIQSLKKRLQSVKNTYKITKSMELVASSKNKLLRGEIERILPYIEITSKMILLLNNKKIFDKKYFFKNNLNKIGILLISTDKGLCGKINLNILNTLLNFLEQKKNPSYSLFNIGNKIEPLLKNKTINNYIIKINNINNVNIKYNIKNIIHTILNKYFLGEINNLYVIYPDFINPLKQEIKLISLFPFNPLLIIKSLSNISKNFNINIENNFTKNEIIDYEPLIHNNMNEWNVLLECFCVDYLYCLYLITKFSENSSRMVLMKQSSDNANDIKESVGLQYNKCRQYFITSEILEIAASNNNI